MLPCKANRQCLLTLQVSRYCLPDFQGRMACHLSQFANISDSIPAHAVVLPQCWARPGQIPAFHDGIFTSLQTNCEVVGTELCPVYHLRGKCESLCYAPVDHLTGPRGRPAAGVCDRELFFTQYVPRKPEAAGVFTSAARTHPDCGAGIGRGRDHGQSRRRNLGRVNFANGGHTSQN